ncbi:MAG: hypothetical protein LBL72_07975 [Candidatus Accumulibacter sp.]|jgi:hypothetical protein|nr:hypothetical protein [Accumulibacter sp.]
MNDVGDETTPSHDKPPEDGWRTTKETKGAKKMRRKRGTARIYDTAPGFQPAGKSGKVRRASARRSL